MSKLNYYSYKPFYYPIRNIDDCIDILQMFVKHFTKWNGAINVKDRNLVYGLSSTIDYLDEVRTEKGNCPIKQIGLDDFFWF